MDFHVDRSRDSLTSRNRLPRCVSALCLLIPAAVLTIFFALPVATLVTRFTNLGVVRSVWRDPVVRRVVWFTTWQAVLSTVLTVAVGMVPAYVLARFEFVGRRLVGALIVVPFVMPTVVVGAAFLALLPDSFDNSVAAIIIAHVFFNVAVIVRGVGGLWEQIPSDLGAAARTLGAPPWQVARHITLPLLAPAIAASASVVFLFTFTSFGVVRLLGGPAHPTLEVEIWQRATRLGDVGVAAVLSAVQLLVLALAIAWFARLQKRHRAQLGLRPLTQRTRARGRRDRAVVGTTALTVLLFVIGPLGALFEGSLRAGTSYSLAAWRTLFSPDSSAKRRGPASSLDVVGSMITSLRFALIAMAIAVVVGTAACVAIVTMQRSGRILDAALMLPLATSAVTIGFGLLITFDTDPFDWRGAPLMIPLGHAVVATPFVVRILLPVLRSIDPDLRHAAMSLGASPMRVLREIDWPVVRRPVLSAAGFALVISLGEFGATSFLTRSGRETMPIAIDRLLAQPGALLHAQGYVLATMLALMTFLVIAAVDGLRAGRNA